MKKNTPAHKSKPASRSSAPGSPRVKSKSPSAALRRASVADVREIQRLINSFADKGEMLPRSLNELYENLRDYLVLEQRGEIIGTVACHVNWEDLAEVKCLAVAEAHRGQGHGARLVQACMEEAGALGLKKLFALTYKPEFFARLGWRQIDKATLPQKIWVECVRCVKFPDCGEVALIYVLEAT